MPPRWAHEPKATSTFDFLREQLRHVLVLAVADRAVEERDVDAAVGHRLDVLVLEVHGDRPEHDVGRRGDLEDLLVDVENRRVAPAAAAPSTMPA